MPIKISKDSHKVINIEFETRQIDINGDSFDVSHYETKEEAIKYAEEILRENNHGDCVAVVVEKHISKYPKHLFNEPDKYSIIFTKGDEKALKLGDWIK